MNTLKAERAMTTSDKLREFGQKVMREYGRWWGVEAKDADKFVSDLTALISEGYIERTKYNELLQQRDELREALLNLWSWVHQIYDWSGVGDPPIERIEAAIKNTETK